MTDDLVKRLLDIGSPLADEAAGVIHRLTAERDARIDPAHVQDLINAAEPMFAEAYAAVVTERDVLNKMLDFEDRPGPRRDALLDALYRLLHNPIDPR